MAWIALDKEMHVLFGHTRVRIIFLCALHLNNHENYTAILFYILTCI